MSSFEGEWDNESDHSSSFENDSGSGESTTNSLNSVDVNFGGQQFG